MLEMELDFTRENLQATIEEVETTNEELQSSNEELTSSNEELQSTNEELHSVNEELHTTNAESSRRLQLLTERTSDLETVMRDSHIGIILLDNDLNIRRTTPAAADLLGIGRRSANGDPISSHATAFKDVDLVDLATQVLEADEPFELETKDRFNEPVLIRASSYEDSTGVILTITNLKTVKDTADKLRKLTSIIADSTDAIIGVDLDYRITSWNRGAIRLFDNVVDASESIDLCSALPEDICNPCEILIRELEKKGEVPATEITTDLGDITRTLLVRATPVLDENERVTSAAITFYDVSKIKAAEEKLRLRNRAIEAATNGFIIVDALDDDMPIIYANEGFFDLTGFRPDDIVGRNCRFLQGNETDPAELRKLRNAIEQGEGTRVTLLNYRRDGTKFYNDLLISPVPDANGTITHFVGIQSDISGLVELNRSLQNSEAEYRSTFENAAVGIAHVGLNGNWLRVNRKLCQIVGYSLEELQQKNFQDITHPDDLDNDLNQFARMKRGEIDGYSMEKRYFHKNGNIIWINLTASLRRDSLGEAECCISIVEDITDRKLTEQKLVASRAIIAEVIETSDDPFISFDRDGGIQVANRAALELTNQTDGPSKTYQELFIHEPESPLTAALDRVRTSQRGESLEYLSRRLNRWYDARVFPVDGGAAVYMTDVTGRKQTETHLERARIAAEEASQAKSKFLTNMSHEIRSPMSAILGYSEISLRELRDGQPVDPEHLETVIRNGRFLLRIINDILDLSKVEAGKLEVRKSLFRLVPMLADIKELMRHRSESCGVPLAFDFDGPVVEQLESDRSRVEQILANLIGNALKFTPSGSVDVKISLVTQPDAFLLIAVADTGIGISASNLSRLFQTFSQVHDNKIVGVEGTGLGLVISKRLATSLGGDIDVTSVEGQGSTFTLRLPVHLESSTKLIEPKSDELKPVLTTSVDLTPVRGRILVADDARDIRMVTKRFLTRAGADVTEAVNGAEAVKAVRQAESEGKPFACILMDMQMPELDGRQATDQLRNEGYTMPIIALTAGATSEEIQDALASGCTEFISKPVNAPDLLARIADLT
jgi:two-component system CheB/CheR fusion protein